MKWKINNKQNIYLLTPLQFKDVIDGTVLIDIFGKKYVKGKDYIDQDTRGGFLAFGMKLKDYNKFTGLQ